MPAETIGYPGVELGLDRRHAERRAWLDVELAEYLEPHRLAKLFAALALDDVSRESNGLKCVIDLLS